MITSVIRAVIRWRAVAWLLLAAGAIVSAYSIRTASLDAIPDISDPQIVVYVKWPRSPQLLEKEVTEPLISALVGSRISRRSGGRPTWGTRSSMWS